MNSKMEIIKNILTILHLRYIALRSINIHRMLSLSVLFIIFGLHQSQAQNSALSFDGTDDYVEISANAGFAPTQGSMTIEAMVKPGSGMGSFSRVWGTNLGAGEIYSTISSSNPRFSFRPSIDGGSQVTVDAPSTWTADTWYHVAGVVDGVSQTVYLYIDGVLVGSNSYTGPGILDVNGTNDRNIGSAINNTAFFSGEIDEVRFWNIARSQQQIEDNMDNELNGNEPGLVAYYDFSDGSGTTLTDQASSNAGANDGTLFGTPTWTTTGPVLSPAPTPSTTLSFDGTNDYVEIPANEDLEPFVSTTIEALVKPEAGMASWVRIWGGTVSDRGQLFASNSGNRFMFRQRIGGTSSTVVEVEAPSDWEPGVWYHVAAVVNGADKEVLLYVNGEEVASATYTGSGVINPDTGIRRIGYNNFGGRFLGDIDEVRFWRVARTQAQIRAKMESELNGREIGLAAYYDFSDGSGTTVTDQMGLHDGTISGSAVWNTSGGISLEAAANSANGTLIFDGVDDYVEIPADAAFDGSGGSMTIEALVKSGSGIGEFGRVWGTNLGAGPLFSSVRQSGNPAPLFSFRPSIDGSQVSLTAPDEWIADRWYHVAGVVDGAAKTVYLYVNGVLVSSATYPGAGVLDVNGTDVRRIGSAINDTEYHLGEIDEVRFWNIARTQAEIKESMENELEGTETGLVAYYDFNGSGTTLTDRTGNHDGTIFGASYGTLGPVLPVELLYFKPERAGAMVNLIWETASEINNDYFIVQRSADGQVWDNIGTVAGNGTTTNLSRYSLKDTQPLIGVNYYRLVQVDYDGEREVFDAELFILNEEFQNIKLYPNPSGGVFTFDLNGTLDKQSIQVINSAAQRVDFLISENSIDISALKDGIYYVILKMNSDLKRCIRVVKKE